MTEFKTDTTGRLLVSKDALINAAIYTDGTYRKNKSLDKFKEIVLDNSRFVLMETLPEQTRRRVVDKFSHLKSEYTQLLLAADGAGLDCAPMAIEFTADTLNINEPFIRSSIETYVNANYSSFTWAYLDAGLHSDSVKGYAKQCALVAWMYDYVNRIRSNEASKTRASHLLRSFRANMLTAVTNMTFEIKIPTSETRFNAWFDEMLKQLDNSFKPEDIIQIKRKGNPNASKITDEQLNIALYWHKNGTNMSVATLYLKWIEWGKQKGWWMKEGVFCPPTEGRLYQLLQPFKNPLMLAKTDAINHRLNAVPTATRYLPTETNHVWVIDGTAHNENVHANGKVRQHVYAIKIMDVASLRILGVAGLIGVKEPFYAVKDAILMGIKETGHKPAIIHCDRGPAWKELERWCEENEIRLYPSITGNARAKTIESMFRMYDSDITRFLDGYSGQNRTATGSITSKPSDSRETKGKMYARSAEMAIQWAKTTGIVEWNERIIKQLERKPCNKTPYEMWEEKPSKTPPLSYMQLCQLCGTMHKRKLTIEGLDIQHNNHSYLYFPNISTPEDRAKADRIFTTIPLDKHNDNPLRIHILEGGKPAPVFDKDGNYLGVWTVKENVAYTAGIDGTKEQKEQLNNIMALQYRVTNTAKELSKQINEAVQHRSDIDEIDSFGTEALTGKRRAFTGRYDKSELLEAEQEEKAGFNLGAEPKFKEYFDEDTGEIHRIRIK